MERLTRYLRQFAGLGTDLTDRYRHNPYTRSTVNVILLQVLLALLVMIAFGYVLKFQQQSTVDTVGNTTQAVLEGRTQTPLLEESLADARSTTFQYVFLGIVLITLFFGYLTAKYALRPTRSSLEFQKRFIGNMAHEIRTPLAIIKTNTEVALMDPALPSPMRETLLITSGELDRISEIINNLLSFNTMFRPSNVSLDEIDLTEAARAVVERHEAFARTRGISLDFTSPGPYPILGNSTGIDQVLTNLVKNALNYTPQHAGGSVTVALRGDAETATVSVTDTGIGIAKKDLFYIFQPFYRADTSRARGVGKGMSGLGLAIVNEIVKAHQGRIFVRSALNRGTTIEVTFPRHQNGMHQEKEGNLEEGIDPNS